jgi:hypothetical protein
VVNSGNPVLGSSMKSEKASGKEPTPGAFVVALNRNEKLVPRVMSVRYSLKKDPPAVDKEIAPGRVPVTTPLLGPLVPRVPVVEKSRIVTVLDEGPPP